MERAYQASASYLAKLAGPLSRATWDEEVAMVPPRLVRRLVLAPLAVVIAVALVVLFPLLALLALVFGALGAVAAGTGCAACGCCASR